MYDNVRFPISLSRAAYWAGRAAEAKKHPKIAADWYRYAAQHPTHYYGQLALLKLDPTMIPVFNTSPSITTEDRKWIRHHELTSIIKLLLDMDEHRYLRKFIKQLTHVAPNEGTMAAIGELGIGTKNPHIAIVSAKYALQKNVKLNHAGYPTLTGINTEGADLSLVFAIIRQESEFRISAASHANAYGMMQLIAPTASRMAKKLKLRYNKNRLVTDPHYNIRLGSYYIGLLLDLYKEHHVPSIAAYNAGPANVNRWFKRSGDPRKNAT